MLLQVRLGRFHLLNLAVSRFHLLQVLLWILLDVSGGGMTRVVWKFY